GIIRDAIVIKGPYSVMYGPGFSFIDIATNPSPRYQNGQEWHGRSVINYKNNGEQLYGRQMLETGDYDWGVRASYGHRTGNDYQTGDGTQIPASYNARDVDFAFGMDLNPNNHLEFGYLRLDQTNIEFPGQIFDTDFLVTNGFRLRYTSEHQEYFDRLVLDG